jgi:hypothetical protein
MGSHPTLDPNHPQQEPTRPWRPPSQIRDELKEGEWMFRRGMLSDDQLLQRRADAAAVNLAPRSGRWTQPTVAELRAEGDHAEADRIADQQRWFAIPNSQAAFDRLNPDFGVQADHRDPLGHQAARDREAALALGVRVTVHDQRQNDPNPVIWQPGQDYRAADAIQAARAQPTRARWGPERTGPER